MDFTYWFPWGMSAADSNIALLPILRFSAKLVRTSPRG